MSEDKKVEKSVSIQEALKTPDAPARQGVNVKVGDLVQLVYCDRMVDSLTLQEYTNDGWTEVQKASAWLDGQLAAGKIRVKG